uniref:Uncharacterized protein n=1 Tax=viral metagenome TaxID=1070528 RepID=A0A6H1ZSL4_9ZZZZ
MKKREKDKHEFYYYLRDDNHNPIGTVCIKKKDGEIARGLTILNSNDRIDKKEGRRWARKYVDKALGTKMTGLPISREEVVEKLDRLYEHNSQLPITETENRFILTYKSVFEPILTSYEYRLLTKGGKNELS